MKKFQVGIIGGGLAGLALAIQLGRRGLSLVLFEMGSYPRHKVCGEYISNESRRFLEELLPGLAFPSLPEITDFQLTSTHGSVANFSLGLGGFGISRHLLEQKLMQEALASGVQVWEQTKVTDVKIVGHNYQIDSTQGQFVVDVAIGSFGKKSVMEKVLGTGLSWEPNYVGVKYHIQTQHPGNQIAIHSFSGGYCGISNVENGVTCLCYIVNSNMLNQAQNKIPQLEKQVLFQNRYLKRIFSQSEFLWEKPLIISNIHFGIPLVNQQNVLLLGDAAGCIAPITGNGMSNALRSAWFATQVIAPYFEGRMSKSEMESQYQRFWMQQFSFRIKLSRKLQVLAEKPWLSSATISLFNWVPGLGKSVVKWTHGKPF